MSFGLHSGSSRSESDAGINSTVVERNIAYIPGTNRTTERRTHFPGPVPVSQPSTSRDSFVHYGIESDRHGQQQVWQYDSAQDEEEQEERLHFYSPTISNSGSTSVTHSRSNEISSNIFKNSQAFLRPFITSGFATEPARSPGPSSSPAQGLYSQVLPSDQDRTSSSPREPRLASTQSTVGRDSEEEDDANHGDEPIPHGEGFVGVARQRSPREQRKERNRKKKERRKQRRYEKWLERQTLGAEEESAIQVQNSFLNRLKNLGEKL